MSTFSHEHHFNLDQTELIDSMKSFFDSEAIILLEEIDLPDSEKERQVIAEKIEPEKIGRFLVVSDHEKNWSLVFSETDIDDEKLVAFIAGQKKCDAIYGHHNDQVDNWRWILFHNGKRTNEYWYLGQEAVRFPEKYPKESKTIKNISQALASLGQVYHHLSFSNVVHAGGTKLVGKPGECRLLTVLF